MTDSFHFSQISADITHWLVQFDDRWHIGPPITILHDLAKQYGRTVSFGRMLIAVAASVDATNVLAFIDDPNPEPVDYELPATLLRQTLGPEYRESPLYVARYLSPSEMRLVYVTPDVRVDLGAMAIAVARVENAWEEIDSVQTVRWYGGVLRIETQCDQVPCRAVVLS